jgi:hypothetical protein
VHGGSDFIINIFCWQLVQVFEQRNYGFDKWPDCRFQFTAAALDSPDVHESVPFSNNLRFETIEKKLQ